MNGLSCVEETMTICCVISIEYWNVTDRIAISISCVITLTHDKNENYKKKQTGLVKEEMQHIKIKPKPTVIHKNSSCVCDCVCTSLHRTVVHNTAQHSSDNFPS